MAWDCNGERICCARARHRAAGRGLPDGLSQLRIAHRGSGANACERFPYRCLKLSPLDIECDIVRTPRILDELDDARAQLFKRRISTDEIGVRKAMMQGLNQGLWVVAQEDRTHTAFGRRHQEVAKRAAAHRKTNARRRRASSRRGCSLREYALVGPDVEAHHNLRINK